MNAMEKAIQLEERMIGFEARLKRTEDANIVSNEKIDSRLSRLEKIVWTAMGVVLTFELILKFFEK